jgi:predicted ATPase
VAFLVESHYALGVTHFYLGAFRTARAHTAQGMALYNPQQHRTLAIHYGGTDPGVACRCYAAQVLCVLGYPDAAVQCNQEALRLAEDLQYPLSLAYALNQTLVLHQLRREGRAAQERAEEVMAFCSDQGFPQMMAMGTILRGWGRAEQGQAEEGIALIRQGLAMNPKGIGLGGPPVLAQLAEAYGAAQRPEEGLALLAEAFRCVDQTEERWYEAELYRLQGALLLQQSAVPAAEAESHFLHALNIARQQQAKFFELRAAMSLSRLWQRQGKRDQAHELLVPIYRWFTEGFDTADLREAKSLLDDTTLHVG